MIILASTSATRRTMLSNAGVTFTAVASDVDEPALVARNPGWSPHEIALRLAEAKALDVARRRPEATVIGADQVLALRNKVYSKPKNEADCTAALRELRGQTHQLISAVACVRGGTVETALTDEANLTMRNFSEEFLDAYVKTMGPDCTTSVGGYKIEGLGIQLFERVEGDHFTILGMPLLPVLSYLRQIGEIAA
jgi:septum formation protein